MNEIINPLSTPGFTIYSFLLLIERVPILLDFCQKKSSTCILCFVFLKKRVCKYLKIASVLFRDILFPKAGAKIEIVFQTPKFLRKFFLIFFALKKSTADNQLFQQPN